MTERKVQPGGFLQKNWSHRNELRLIFHDIKKGVCFFFCFDFFFFGICSYSFKSDVFISTFTVIFYTANN